MFNAVQLLAGVSKGSLRKLRLAGDQAQSTRQWARAIENYEKFLKHRPNIGPIWVQVGHAYKELGRFDEANKAYRQALHVDPADGDALLHLSAMLRTIGRHEEAAALTAADVGSQRTVASVRTETFHVGELESGQRADLARDQRDWPTAAVFYCKHLSEHPHDAGRWVQLGHVLKEQSLFDEAIYAYEAGKRLETTPSDVSLHLAALLMHLGRTQDAKPLWAEMFDSSGAFFLQDRPR